MRSRHAFLALAALSFSTALIGAEKTEALPDPVSYYKHIRPVFQAKCQGCHQPSKAKADYIMTEVAALIKGGENGAAIVPGKPAESHLLELVVTAAGEKRPEMPPKEEPLTPYEVSLVTKWVEQGAKDDTPENARQQYTMANPPRYAVPPVVNSLDYSPDGSLLAVAGFHEVLVHKADGSGLVKRLVGLSERIQSVRFSPDGKKLAVAGGLPGRMGEIQVWDLEKAELILSKIVGFDTAYGASWSPDGTLVAFGLPDNTVRAIQAANGEQVLFMGSHNDWVLDTDWSTKGDHLISVGRDMTAKLTETATERFIDNLTSITPGALAGGLNTIDRHPTQDHILVGGSDGVPQIYRTKRETVRKIGDNANLIRKYPAMKGRIWDAAFAPDGKTFAAVSSLDATGQIHLFKSEYDATITPELKKLFETVQRAPDSEGKVDPVLDEFYTRGAELLKGLDLPAAMYSVAFAPDGKTIATGGADGKIRLLDAKTLAEKKTFAPIAIDAALPEVKPDPTLTDRKKAKHHETVGSLPEGRTVTSIALTPADLAFDSAARYAQVLATATLDDGTTADVTGFVKWAVNGPAATVSDRGIVRPAAAGEGTLTATLGDKNATAPVKYAPAATVAKLDFVQDVNPVITRLGCNMGTCHGAKDGKGGFKLSLRGYDPIYDVRGFADDHTARRVNFASPDDSLMLLKATGAVPHEAGMLTDHDSRYYHVIREWIASGAKLDTKAAKVASIELFPKNPVIQNLGGRQQFRVVARYADGKTRDVTLESYLESGNTEVAEHDEFGLLHTVRRGEAPILARYEGAYAATTLTVMGDRKGFTWKAPESWGEIDKLVAAKWERMKLQPSELCTDEEFVRRVHLDLTGLPPASDRVKSFLADDRPTRVKRDALVDELIKTPEYTDHWTNKWSDMLQVNSKFLGDEGTRLYRDWIRKQIETNAPYDQFAYQILTASGSNKENPAASYYKILREPAEIVENTTHLFLATRFNCNKCHDHPFERWTQDQYYETAAYFAQVGLNRDGKNAPNQNIGGSAVEGAKPLYEVIADKPEGELKHDRTGAVTAPEFPYQADLAKVAFAQPDKPTRREQFAAWVVSADNPYFATSYANRVWGYLLGTGIIEPLDDIRAGNPPTNPQLLDYLSAQFVKSGFNIRALTAEICKSRTYQLSIATNDWNAGDEINFSRAKARRLPAEVLYDSVHFVTGAISDIPGAGRGVRASQLPDAKLDLKSGFLANLGRPVRESACECERSSELQMSAIMAFLSGPAIADAIGAKDSDLAKLVATQPDDRKLVEEIYYRILSRAPSAAEIDAALAVMKDIDSDHQVLTAKVAKAEADWVPVKSQREIARLQAIAKASTELAAYQPEAAKKKAEGEAAQKARIAAATKALADFDGAVPAKLTEWEKSLTLASFWTRWTSLTPSAATTNPQSGITVAVEPDGTVLASGAPKNVVYTVTIPVKAATTLSGLQLEALPDERLPGYGPGLSANGNFVVSGFNAAYVPVGGDAKKPMALKFNDAKTDFIQQGFDVKNSINGQATRDVKGWAIGGNESQPNWARYQFEKPLAIDAKGGTLTLTIHCQYAGGEYPLGKFKVWATNSASPLEAGIPSDVAVMLQTEPSQRSAESKAALASFFQSRSKDRNALASKLSMEKKPLPADAKLLALEAAVKTAELPIKEDPKLVEVRQNMDYSTQQAANRRLTASQDLAWALVNSSSFLFNR
jgi:WD40 repeat protein